ncbi:MAG: aminotransferase [Clostridia bacterium]|nr:aminotransferase [Clostridia bacterium]
MKIKDFGVEIWMNLYENNCQYNLAETCVESLTLNELLEMSGEKDAVIRFLLDMQLNYGAIEGSDVLRHQLMNLYDSVKDINRITVTHGAIGGNALAMFTLVEPGDHVISVLPTYQQHYSIPESLGADVDILQLKPEHDFLPSIDELKNLMRSDTKLICINNPNNPTGALMDEGYLKAIVDVAKTSGAYILCDEVYRGLNHEGDYYTTSIVDLYEKGIATSSMSKTYSLAGLRLGWLVGPLDVVEQVNRRRDYNTISCGKIDDCLAALAMQNKDKILQRNRAIIHKNIELLDAWVKKEPKLSYVRPKAGTTAFIKYDGDISSEDFCVRLLEKKGVMLVPGAALHMEGYLRIGYAYSPSIFKIGLEKISEFLNEEL